MGGGWRVDVRNCLVLVEQDAEAPEVAGQARRLQVLNRAQLTLGNFDDRIVERLPLVLPKKVVRTQRPVVTQNRTEGFEVPAVRGERLTRRTGEHVPRSALCRVRH